MAGCRRRIRLETRAAPRGLSDFARLARRLALDAPLESTIVTSGLAVLVAGPPTIIDGGLPQPTAATASFLLAAAVVNGRLLAIRLRAPLEIRLLDAVAVAFLIGLTGGGGSPFYPLALAGLWWAGQPRTSRGVSVYAAGFAVAYALLVFPGAVARGDIASPAWDLVAFGCVGALLAWVLGIDQRLLALNDQMIAVRPRADRETDELSLRQGLAAILGAPDAPVDAVLAASHVGLTVEQTRLLGYLILGLATREIAEALSLSESAVRYRLTGLYRTLGVRGRRSAVARARSLGISGMPASES